MPYVFQNGQTFGFMLQPSLASLLATILTPLLSSIIFLISSRTIGGFGAASSVAVIMLGMNSLANIASTGDILTPFLPWYLLITVIPVVASDVILHKEAIVSRIGIAESRVIACALIGSVFYLMGFPVLVWTLAQPLSGNAPFQSMYDILPKFLDTLPIVLGVTMVPGAVMGIAGALISSKTGLAAADSVLHSVKLGDTGFSSAVSHVIHNGKVIDPTLKDMVLH